MKQGEIRNHKNYGTIQMGRDDNGKTCYFYTHSFFNNTYETDMIKDAVSMLDYYQEKAVKIQEAIRTLRGTGYKVFKEIA